MVKLTETMILQRTKKGDLESVRKLNCWGSDLTDVSIVRRMPYIQVLSLSVNQISSLEDFAYCTSLEELYLRKNAISDINELFYLQDLPQLRVLWLAENPCAESADYRTSVLRVLPNLQMLDNLPVTLKELRQVSGRLHQVLDDMQPLPVNTSLSESVSEYSAAASLLKPPNANVLHAVLSLVKELDRPSLEIVDDAVRNLIAMSSYNNH